MGLRKFVWPFGGSDPEDEEDLDGEHGGQVHEENRTGARADNTSQTPGIGSEAVEGVMQSSGVESPEERTVLSTDESTGLEESNEEAPGERKDISGRGEEENDSGKTVEDFLSGDLGEEPVEEHEEEPESGEEEDHEDSDDRVEEEEEESSFSPDTLRSSTPDRGGRHGEHDDTFMELPDACVTESESPDPDASAEEMIPEPLPGWDLQKTDRYRWQMDNALDYINATYRDPGKRRYMFHVSKWKPRHVKYALDELYGFHEPHPFDVWAARGQFVFAVKIVGGTVDNAHTLLMAAPALSKSYFQYNEEEGFQ